MSGSSSASTSGASDQGFVEQHSTVLGIVNDIVNALDNDQTDHPFLATASSEPLTDPIGALGDYLEHSGLPREFVDQIGPLSVKYVLAYTLRLQRLVAARDDLQIADLSARVHHDKAALETLTLETVTNMAISEPAADFPNMVGSTVHQQQQPFATVGAGAQLTSPGGSVVGSAVPQPAGGSCHIYLY